MKITISIPEELERELREHIKVRFGNEKARAMSLIIREALKDFLGKQNESRSNNT